MTLAIGAALLAGGCRTTDAVSSRLVPTTEMLHELFPSAPFTDVATGIGGASEVTVAGRIHVDAGCHELTRAASLSGSELTVTMIVTARDQPCLGVVGATDYTVVVPDLAPGAYHVEVRHLLRSLTHETVVTAGERDVTVH